MHRPDETPTVDVLLNMLGGLGVAVLLFALGGALRAVDNNLIELD